MKVVIADCDHLDLEEEARAAATLGIDFDPTPTRSTDPGAITEHCADADGILLQYANFDAALMDALPRLKALGRYGVGVDSIDIDAATARGIAVFNVPDYGTDAVSDHAIALAMALLRDIGHQHRLGLIGQANFELARPIHLTSHLVFGVVGAGRIGRATAAKAAALGFRVIVHDIATDADYFHGLANRPLDKLLAEADIVCLHTPLTPDSRHLIDAAALALMKPTALLINTARGAVIDTDALINALRAGHLRGAGLDTVDPEPVDPKSPLFELPQVIITPHLAWYTEETYSELKRRTMTNVARYLLGRGCDDIVNPQVLTSGRTPTSTYPTESDQNI
ncbi:MAG: C-terminal binding protein [Propionibacteriaceae bacterium]|jgi:D-3-phosphoglycerate dehydrogenase|nr:C-terminal binding protein [Propionibacteriaceae bacterium]